MLFLYLIDELENLTANHQRYVNTLIREREAPCSFRVGARRYGIRTYETLSAEEVNREGSEFEEVRLDDRVRKGTNYAKFAAMLCTGRLLKSGVVLPTPMQEEPVGAMGLFYLPGSGLDAQGIGTTHLPDRQPYFEALRDKLLRGIKLQIAPGLTEARDADMVIDALRITGDPLLEKTSTFLLYKDWSANRDLRESAHEIAISAHAYRDDTGSKGRHHHALAHFKGDLIAQLLRELQLPQRYLGFETFVDMACGLPRALLTILKHTHRWAIFNGEDPYSSTQMGHATQTEGVREASEWFYRDARVTGARSPEVLEGVERLATLFRAIRFSDKPSECSLCAFSVDLASISERSRSSIDLAISSSLLVDVSGGQKDRNTPRVDANFSSFPCSHRDGISQFREGGNRSQSLRSRRHIWRNTQ